MHAMHADRSLPERAHVQRRGPFDVHDMRSRLFPDARRFGMCALHGHRALRRTGDLHERGGFQVRAVRFRLLPARQRTEGQLPAVHRGRSLRLQCRVYERDRFVLRDMRSRLLQRSSSRRRLALCPMHARRWMRVSSVVPQRRRLAVRSVLIFYLSRRRPG